MRQCTTRHAAQISRSDRNFGNTPAPGGLRAGGVFRNSDTWRSPFKGGSNPADVQYTMDKDADGRYTIMEYDGSKETPVTGKLSREEAFRLLPTFTGKKCCQYPGDARRGGALPWSPGRRSPLNGGGKPAFVQRTRAFERAADALVSGVVGKKPHDLQYTMEKDADGKYTIMECDGSKETPVTGKLSREEAFRLLPKFTGKKCCQYPGDVKYGGDCVSSPTRRPVKGQPTSRLHYVDP